MGTGEVGMAERARWVGPVAERHCGVGERLRGCMLSAGNRETWG
jgi:hypothetical protein